MATVTSPACAIPMSAICHSGRFDDQSATRSWGLSPSASRAFATRLTHGDAHAATIRELRKLAISLWQVVTYPYGTEMVVGTCELIFQLPENHSLKGKRQVSRSLVQQLRGRFNVSVAEVADLDRWQTLAIGVTCVSNDSRHANEMLSKIIDFVEDHNGGAVLHQHHIEILRT